ncbi:leucyl aminopeptidase family protein [Phaeodactylibacter luteus]|nr:leucyl aminopeptidase family protein [Phaeodactylibacter luteus]
MMEISSQNTIEKSISCLLFPIAKTDAVKDQLAKAARLAGQGSELLSADFTGAAGEKTTLYGNGLKIHLIGLGEPKNWADLIKPFRSFSHKQAAQLSAATGVWLGGLTSAQALRRAEAAAHGLLLGTYQLGRFRQEPAGQEHPLAQEGAQLMFFGESLSAEEVTAAGQKGLHLAATQMQMMDLVNAPSNYKTPEMLASWALASGEAHGYSVKVLDKAAIQQEGLHALLAVNRGSEVEPRFIIMEYQGQGGNLPKIGLVGKGVTFDTGGVSIKPSTNMHYMKSDMGGAAAVLGTMEAAAKLRLPVHLIGIVPATDNCVDANAIKPGDVIGSYSGKTIEVTDTDAEGRLILADGIAYMLKHYAPDTLIDLATLTGSAVRTFGYHAAALFSSSESLQQQLMALGEAAGERVWPLPLWEVYEEDLKSDTADVRNFSGRPMAGAINAAKFLEFFTHQHPNWAHLDIAGVAFGDNEFSVQKSASGYGLRLLTAFLETF